jgi:hypothetical protein
MMMRKKHFAALSPGNMSPTHSPVRSRFVQRRSSEQNDLSAELITGHATPHFGYDFSRVRTYQEASRAAYEYVQAPVGLGRLQQQAGEQEKESETPIVPETAAEAEQSEEAAPPAQAETRPEPKEAQEEAAVTPAIIEPARIVRDKNLWWFDGEDAANYDEEAKLTAFGTTRGATRGTFRWDVVRGAGKIDFENNADTMTRVNANRVGIKSTDASDAMGDVKVRCRWSHGTDSKTLFHSFTVRAPDEGVVVNGPHDAARGGGYVSQYVIEVRDQFGRRLPRDVEVNESWGRFVADLPGVSNWLIAPPNGAMTGPPNGPATAQFTETYGMPGGGGRVPASVNPGAPGSGTRVMHATQFYRAGSTTVGRGRLIETHTAQYHRGRARQ